MLLITLFSGRRETHCDKRLQSVAFGIFLVLQFDLGKSIQNFSNFVLGFCIRVFTSLYSSEIKICINIYHKLENHSKSLILKRSKGPFEN